MDAEGSEERSKLYVTLKDKILMCFNPFLTELFKIISTFFMYFPILIFFLRRPASPGISILHNELRLYLIFLGLSGGGEDDRADPIPPQGLTICMAAQLQVFTWKCIRKIQSIHINFKAS